MDIMTITYHWLRHTLVGVMLLLPTAVSTAYSVQHTPYSVQRTAYSALSGTQLMWSHGHRMPRSLYIASVAATSAVRAPILRAPYELITI